MQKYIYLYWEPGKVGYAMFGTTVTNQQASNHLQRGHYKKHTNIDICWRVNMSVCKGLPTKNN